MIKKHFYTWNDIENCCISIVNQMYKDEWRPDYIVGITRGGNVPATIISNMTGIRCEALKVSLRDDNRLSDSACWMAEDAFGYPQQDTNGQGKNILIVDDLLATGGTAEATCKLITKLKGNISGFVVLIELEFLEGRKKLNQYNVHSIVKY